MCPQKTRCSGAIVAHSRRFQCSICCASWDCRRQLHLIYTWKHQSLFLDIHGALLQQGQQEKEMNPHCPSGIVLLRVRITLLLHGSELWDALHTMLPGVPTGAVQRKRNFVYMAQLEVSSLKKRPITSSMPVLLFP